LSSFVKYKLISLKKGRFFVDTGIVAHLVYDFLQTLDFGDSFHAEPLEISRQRADQRPFVTVQLG